MFWRDRVHVLHSYPVHTHLVLGCQCLEVHLWKLNPFEQCRENSESLFTVNNVRFKKSGSLPLTALSLISPWTSVRTALQCVIWAFGIVYSRANPGCCYILLLFTGSETNLKVLMKQKTVPVTTACSRSCLKIKSKSLLCFHFPSKQSWFTWNITALIVIHSVKLQHLFYKRFYNFDKDLL